MVGNGTSESFAKVLVFGAIFVSGDGIASFVAWIPQRFGFVGQRPAQRRSQATLAQHLRRNEQGQEMSNRCLETRYHKKSRNQEKALKIAPRNLRITKEWSYPPTDRK